MKYKAGKNYLARLIDDGGFLGKYIYDCEAKILEVKKDKMVVNVFCDTWRKHEYNLDGVRLDGQAYLVEK